MKKPKKSLIIIILLVFILILIINKQVFANSNEVLVQKNEYSEDFKKNYLMTKRKRLCNQECMM